MIRPRLGSLHAPPGADPHAGCVWGRGLKPPALMLHLFTELWGEKTLLTHVGIIPGAPDQYGGVHSFFDVVSPY